MSKELHMKLAFEDEDKDIYERCNEWKQAEVEE